MIIVMFVLGLVIGFIISAFIFSATEDFYNDED